MLKTVTLPGGYTITMDAQRVEALRRAIAGVRLGAAYDYENVDGSVSRGTFEGFKALNTKFRKENGEEFLAPVVDMGDGSFFTEYLTEVRSK
jgi:hypothetical protein